MRPSILELKIRNVERRHEVVAVFDVGAGDVGGERVAFPIGTDLQLRRGDKIRSAARAGDTFRIGVVAGGQIERRQQQERAGADAERRVGIARRERQRPLRHGSRRQRIGLRRRRRRGARRVVEIFRRRHGQDGAGAVGRRQRMYLRRRIAQRRGSGGGGKTAPVRVAALIGWISGAGGFFGAAGLDVARDV